METKSLFHKHSKPHPILLNKLRASEANNFNLHNAHTIITPGNSTTIKKNDNTYNINNRNNSACSMNSTKQLINNEILKKKYSVPCSKETTTLSNLLNKNPLQINKRLQGPLSQRLLKKTENLKVIDDLYELPKPNPNQKNNIIEHNNGILDKKLSQQEKSISSKKQTTEKKKTFEAETIKQNERKPSYDFTKENTPHKIKSSIFEPGNQILMVKSVSKKHHELNNLIRVLQQQNNEKNNFKLDKTELQRKILNIKEKLQRKQTIDIKESKIKQSNLVKAKLSPKQQGFFSHRGIAKYSKEDEYLIIQKSKEEKAIKDIIKDIPNEIADIYLLTNENSNQDNNNQLKYNTIREEVHLKSNNNSRSLNESDLEKLINNPNIQISNKRFDFQGLCTRNNSTNGTIFSTLNQKKSQNNDNIMGRKYSLDDKKKTIINNLEEKVKEKGKKIGNLGEIQENLNALKDRISNTLGKYKEKGDKLKEINNFLYNKIKREGIV